MNDVLGAMAASEPAPEDNVASAVEAGTDGEAPADGEVRSAPSGPVSTRQLRALPKGVSPEVAAMLGLPEASTLEEPEPEEEAPAAEAVVAPPETGPESSRGGLLGTILVILIVGAVAAWYATRPPALDTSLYETLTVEEPRAGASPVVEIAFLPVPDPIVPEPTTGASSGGSSGERRSRSVRTDVREEDLF